MLINQNKWEIKLIGLAKTTSLYPLLPRYSKIGTYPVSDTYPYPIQHGYALDTYPRSIRKKNKSTIIWILFMDTLTLFDTIVRYSLAHQQLVGWLQTPSCGRACCLLSFKALTLHSCDNTPAHKSSSTAEWLRRGGPLLHRWSCELWRLGRWRELRPPNRLPVMASS
jgi:hypothetical protein